MILRHTRRQAKQAATVDTDNTVRFVNDGFTYPAVADVIKVTLTPGSANTFTVRIENVSNDSTLVTSTASKLSIPLAPGVWVVHTDDAPLFTNGQADRDCRLRHASRTSRRAPR